MPTCISQNDLEQSRFHLRTCLSKRIAKLQLGLDALKGVDQSKLSSLQTSNFSCSFALIIYIYIYIYACAVVSSLFELQDAQYLRLILYLRMHAKIGEVIKGLENVANEIETVYNGGVVDGFDKKSVS